MEPRKSRELETRRWSCRCAKPSPQPSRCPAIALFCAEAGETKKIHGLTSRGGKGVSWRVVFSRGCLARVTSLNLTDLEHHDFCGFDLHSSIKGLWMSRELLSRLYFRSFCRIKLRRCYRVGGKIQYWRRFRVP
jgi:hypothetical protein